MLVRASAPDGGGGGAISDTTMVFHESGERRGIYRSTSAQIPSVFELKFKFKYFLNSVRVRPPHGLHTEAGPR